MTTLLNLLNLPRQRTVWQLIGTLMLFLGAEPAYAQEAIQAGAVPAPTRSASAAPEALKQTGSVSQRLPKPNPFLGGQPAILQEAPESHAGEKQLQAPTNETLSYYTNSATGNYFFSLPYYGVGNEINGYAMRFTPTQSGKVKSLTFQIDSKSQPVGAADTLYLAVYPNVSGNFPPALNTAPVGGFIRLRSFATLPTNGAYTEDISSLNVNVSAGTDYHFVVYSTSVFTASNIDTLRLLGDNATSSQANKDRYNVLVYTNSPPGFAWRRLGGTGNYFTVASNLFWDVVIESATTLAAPTLTAPANGATGVALRPTLSWNAVTGAASYSAEVSLSPSFATINYFNYAATGTTLSFSSFDLAPNTTHYWRVRAKSGSDSSANSAAFSFTTGGSGGGLATPTLDSPTDAASNQPTELTLSWNAVSGATGYDLQTALDAQFSSPGNFSDITTASYTIFNFGNGQTYYWRVRAKNGSTTTAYSTPRSFRVVAAETPTLSYTFPATPATADYKLITVPGEVTNLKVKDLVSGNQKTDWRMYEENGGTSPAEMTAESPLTTNRGYWLVQKGNFSKTLSLTTANLASAFVTGWNIVGSPKVLANPLGVSSFLVNYGLPADADVWDYNGGFQKVTDAVQPYRAYYVFKPAAAKPAVSATQTLLAAPSSRTEVADLPAVTASGSASVTWKIQLRLQSDGTADRENFLGIAPAAKTGQDDFDKPKPPLVFDCGFLYFPRPDWDTQFSRFRCDYRPALGEGQVWEFETRTPKKTPGTISFDGIGSIPDGNQVWLVNLDNSAQPVDLKAAPAYTYQPAAEITHFKLIVGTESFALSQAADAQPKQFALLQNYPNPFNPSTAIAYQVAATGDVQLKVYDVLGREVQTLVNGRQSAGNYTVRFNAAGLASGVYFYRLSVSSSGSQSGAFVETKKMILTK